MPHFTLHDGLLQYKNRVWLGSNKALQLKVIQALRGSAVGGHSGVPVTYRKLKQLFAWTGMKQQVHEFVKSCFVCQQAKPDRAKYPGLLQPLPVPSGAWQVVSLDFVKGLPRSGKMDCILMVVNRFSKYAHFVALSRPFSAQTVAHLFFNIIYKLHGLPKAIVSDRDKIFTSVFWSELFRLAHLPL